MNIQESTKLMILTHVSDKRCTLASVGALYGMAIAVLSNAGVWPEINRAIMVRFAPDDASIGRRKLEVVKDHGWRLYEAVTKVAA